LKDLIEAGFHNLWLKLRGSPIIW